MPDDYPPYPSHAQALAYLRAYARQFGLYEHIEFGRMVTQVAPVEGGEAWEVSVAGEERPRRYRGVVIANGHHWDPLWPDYPGRFAGEVLHARQYKSAEQLRGRRVLVVGAGNSGCDIAVEAAQHAEAAFLSLRRGYHFLPKFLLGAPVDGGNAFLHRWHAPLWLRRWITGWLVHIAQGPLERYGLPAPDHALFETHPIVNSQLLYWLGHGKIGVRPDVQELAGDRVRFIDGREEIWSSMRPATSSASPSSTRRT
jgi:cation diffusion facilitator CzcD-associated flavoprotein CzcO